MAKHNFTLKWLRHAPLDDCKAKLRDTPQLTTQERDLLQSRIRDIGRSNEWSGSDSDDDEWIF